MSWIGRRVPAVDWESKTSGRESFTADVRLDGTLLARVLRSPHCHAEVTSIDTARARRIPGVHAVITSADFVTGAMYEHSGGSLRDRYPLARHRVRYVGEELAAVAAESGDIADAAVAAIEVRYRPLASILDVQSAVNCAAPLHSRGGSVNVAIELNRDWGDVHEARRRSAASVGGSFIYPRVAHVPMETNTTLASWDPVRQVMDVWTSSQSPWFVVDEIANLLGLAADQVVCHDVSTGGGFGSKSHISEHEVLAAALSKMAGRPVLLQLDRAEEFAATKPRHAFRIDATAHADVNGRICMFEAKLDVDNGAYNHYGPSVMAAAAKKFGSIYEPVGVRVVGRLIDTTLPPGGQFRGYGSPQATFAIESLVDELAASCGEDPIAFRRLNANRPKSTTVAGLRIGSARLVECLDAVSEAIQWEARRARPLPGHGVGVAVAIHGSGAHVMAGSNRSEVVVEVGDDGRVTLRFGGADAGTGQRTVLAQIVAEELCVDVDDVVVSMSDQSSFDLGAWSSRGTHMGGHAASQGAREVAKTLRTLAAEKFGCDAGDVRLEHGRAVVDGGEIPFAELVPLSGEARDGRIVHRGEHVEERMELATESPSANYSASYAFAAHAVEVSVDLDTGRVDVVDYVAAHDIGRALNPTMVEGQIIGAVVQGLGAALREELLLDHGRVVNGALSHYPLPRFADAPRVRTILLEGPEEAGPYDAKGIGEIPIVPVAPAIANAVHHAIGIRFRELPITPDRVLRALRDRGDMQPRDHRLWRRPSRWQIEVFRRAYPRGLQRLLDWGTKFARRPAPAPLSAIERPEALDAAVRAIAAPRAIPVGGATDVIVQRQQGLLVPVTLVSTSRLTQLQRLEVLPDGSLVLGAAVALQRLDEDARLPTVLREAVRTIASSQIRATATVAGNLLQAKRCWYFRNGFPCYKRGGWTCPCYAVTGDHRFQHAVIGGHRCQAVTPSDLATVLVALDAVATVGSERGYRDVPLSRLYDGPGESVLRPDELLVEVRLPPGSSARAGSFQKLCLYQGDFAIASVALTISCDAAGRLRDARVVLGALAPVPWRSHAVEAALAGIRAADLDVTSIVDTFNGELDRVAHPLRDNAWKLDAAAGLLRKALVAVQEHWQGDGCWGD
jgi:CO/xanthine dehydrogenase Mo-binding subunit/CO/xanthine dehydrogenase FAD-binding subunit